MSGFDRIIVVDWSASATPSPAKPSGDAIWMAVWQSGGITCTYHRTRSDVMAAIHGQCDAALRDGTRVLIGFDFPFGYPAGFARAVTGRDDPLALWATLAAQVEDGDDNANNRFDVARGLNRLFPGVGPFWGCPAGQADADLPAKGSLRHGHGMHERRIVEKRLPKAQPCWKLYTTGSVGSQALLGIARLEALRARFGEAVAVAPFQAPTTPIVLAEVYPSLLDDVVQAHRGVDEIKDRAQVRVLAEALANLPEGQLDALLTEGDRQEGWILGLGHEAALRAAIEPRLRNDCFALPPGAHWTPVEEALEMLKARLTPIAKSETVPIQAAHGRILAQAVHARRAHPPRPNTAVDGYGFAGGREAGAHAMPLMAQVAAAGRPCDVSVPAGHAIRILTGAALPTGVDTVLLQEESTIRDGTLHFEGPVKPGANTRAAGEDVTQGETVLPAGRRLTPADLGLAAATGVADVAVYRPLRVAVVSTGDELVDPSDAARDDQIFDANRPMLLAQLAGFGFEPVDMGRAPDDRTALRERLDRAAARADVILTSGGASAGDEDHVSALLEETGSMALWRVAIKPGRPLALGLWGGVPVFGLPGNPVAALVCTLVFAAPALSQMSGAGWTQPQGFDLPAAFEKRKKPGRREYLRARVRGGRVEVFASEGSGRIRGLSWAEGLVELPHGAAHVMPGDPVRFIPWTGFQP